MFEMRITGATPEDLLKNLRQAYQMMESPQAPTAAAAAEPPPKPVKNYFAGVKYSKDEVLLLLQEVNTKRGKETAKACLARVNATSLAKVQPENYSDLVDACNEALR